MNFADFEAFARSAYDEIPEPYKAGVDGLVVRRDSVGHPDRADVWTLGECLTEEHLSDYGSSDTTRSVIALYWGSFRKLAERSEDFDWEGEAWETLTHELRHHLESLAGDDALEDVDYAAEETFKRFDGEPFDPWYYQGGDVEGPGLYRVERALYLEIELTDEDFAALEDLRFELRGTTYRCPRPDDLGDVHFIAIENEIEGEELLELVLVRRRGWFATLVQTFLPTSPVVLESMVTAEPIVAEGGTGAVAG